MKFFEFTLEFFGSGCSKKVKYNRWETAVKVANKMNEKPTTRRVLEPYKCSSCGKYHIGGRS